MASTSNNSNGDLHHPLTVKLPKTGLFHFGFLWGLLPGGLVILLHTSMMWENFLDISMPLYMLDLFSVILPIQLLYFLLHFYLRPRLRFASSITSSISCNLLIIPLAHPFVLLADINMYEKSRIDWWNDWFIHFPELFKFFPAWFIVSILLTLLEVLLYIRSSKDREETAVVLPTESQTLNPEETMLNSAQVESKIVMIESIQQYKTIYRLTPEGVSEETIRKSFDELRESSANNLLKVHKSFMVAPDLIERIERDGRNYSLILKHISKGVPISRNKLEDVRALLL